MTRLRKWKQIRHVEKVYSVKTKSTESFSSFQLWNILETGKKTAKGKEAFEGKFVVIVEVFAR